MEKYGFVYLWYDKKHKRFYIGCRWGSENDGYICSSNWMKQGYKHRSRDFKRRILARVYTNKKDLLNEEYKWLSMIKTEELKKRYYNLHNHHFGHWTTENNINIRLKMSKSQKRRFKKPEEIEKMREIAKKRQFSQETKKRMSASKIGNKNAIGNKNMLGKKHSLEAKRKMSESAKKRYSE